MISTLRAKWEDASLDPALDELDRMSLELHQRFRAAVQRRVRRGCSFQIVEGFGKNHALRPFPGIAMIHKELIPLQMGHIQIVEDAFVISSRNAVLSVSVII